MPFEMPQSDSPEHSHPTSGASRADPDDAAAAAAFEALFRTHYAGLCAFVYGYVRSRDVARELVQDLFLRLWEMTGTPRSGALTKAYLYTAARNRAVRHIRHQRVEARWIEAAGLESDRCEVGPDETVQEHDAAAAIARAVAGLPERCRLVFTLSRSRHLSTAEIAEVLGISPNTVEQHMWRALKALRAKLAPYLTCAIGAASIGVWSEWLK
jgi:RNA polymerase sigma-70 factor (ECF subfamily)